MLEEPDLTPAERALCELAATGRLLDLRAGRPDEDNPARGRMWGRDRQIRAELLRQLLAGQGCLDQAFGAPLAVRLRGAKITGRVNLGGLTLRCPLELYGCFLGGRLDLAKVKAPDISLRGTYLCQRLSARRLRLDHNLNLSAGFHCHGQVNLLGAYIAGQLNCEGATLSNPDGWAVSADWVVADGGLFLSGAQVTGQVRLLGAHIGGQLVCEGTTFSTPGGWALYADGLIVDGGLFLSGAQVTGQVRLRGARVTGQLACDGATLTNRNRTALSADGLVIEGDLVLSGAQVTGEVRVPGARITGQFACTEAKFANSRRSFTNPDSQALTADRLVVDRGLFLNRAQVTGGVRLAGAHIGGQLVCDEARFTNDPNGWALILQDASVKAGAVIRPAGLTGGIDLTNAQVGRWDDDKKTWPAALRLEGFVYEAIVAPNVTPQQRLDWLRRHQGGYVPQAYEQLAAVYRRAGDHEGARTVAIAKQQARRAQMRNWWARWPSQAWSGFLRWTIGYGYRPALALPWLIGLFVVGWFVFDHAYPTRLSPATSGPEQPGFHSARYTLDLLLPVANLNQRDAFIPHGYAAWWTFGLSLAGWLLAAVVVAGLTGVFKRD